MQLVGFFQPMRRLLWMAILSLPLCVCIITGRHTYNISSTTQLSLTSTFIRWMLHRPTSIHGPFKRPTWPHRLILTYGLDSSRKTRLPSSSACTCTTHNTFPSCQVNSLHGWHSRHSHVPPDKGACKLRGDVPQQPPAYATRLTNRCQQLEERGSKIHKDGEMHSKAPAVTALWGANPLERRSSVALG